MENISVQKVISLILMGMFSISFAMTPELGLYLPWTTRIIRLLCALNLSLLEVQGNLQAPQEV